MINKTHAICHATIFTETFGDKKKYFLTPNIQLSASVLVKFGITRWRFIVYSRKWEDCFLWIYYNCRLPCITIFLSAKWIGQSDELIFCLVTTHCCCKTMSFIICISFQIAGSVPITTRTTQFKLSKLGWKKFRTCITTSTSNLKSNRRVETLKRLLLIGQLNGMKMSFDWKNKA